MDLGPGRSEGRRRPLLPRHFPSKVAREGKNRRPDHGIALGACDDDMTVIINGKKVVQQTGHAGAVIADVRPLLKSGQNVLAVKCHNDTGPACDLDQA